MSDTVIIELALRTMLVALKLSAPILVTSLVIGFTISLFQSLTQIQEVTLSFVPKLLGVAATFLIALPWTIQLLVKYTTELYRSLPSLVS